MSRWIIELQEGCWVADWDGDPGRTVVRTSAKLFKSQSKAQNELNKILRYRTYKNPKILKVEEAIASNSPETKAVRAARNFKTG